MTSSGSGRSSSPFADPSDDALSTTVTRVISAPLAAAIDFRHSLRRAPVFQLMMMMWMEAFIAVSGQEVDLKRLQLEPRADSRPPPYQCPRARLLPASGRARRRRSSAIAPPHELGGQALRARPQTVPGDREWRRPTPCSPRLRAFRARGESAG